MIKKIFEIGGMHCASCATLNEKTLNKLEGIKSANVNINTNKATVEYDELIINETTIIENIEKNGFTAKIYNPKFDNNNSKSKDIQKSKLRLIYSIIFTIPVISMMFFHIKSGITLFGVDLGMYIYAILTFVVVYVFGFHFHKSAFEKLKRISFNMDSLISLGTNAAFLFSIRAMFNMEHVYFEAAATIITLINMGKYLESISKSKASEGITKLMQLGAKKATKIIDGKEIETDIEQLKIGDIVLVKTGSKIPIDGIILEGNASIDESMISGESIPVEKQKGDNVIGGTINVSGLLNVEVTTKLEESMLSQIIRLVEEAQGSKAPIQKLADKVSGIFVPIVIGVAVFTFIVWYIISGDISISLIPAVSVLVIACPCSLGLATPTAIMVGTGTGAGKGILIKNGESIEKSSKIDAVIFDKTGTLTNGQPQITNIGGENKDIIKKYALSLSILSDHPISKAISKHLKDEGKIEIENFEEIAGKGTMGKLVNENIIIYLGNSKIIESNGLNIEESLENETNNLLENGNSVVYIGENKKVIGFISFMDLPKESSKTAIDKLKHKGIDIHMISGDNEKTVSYIAGMIGIDNYSAEVLPEEKSKFVKEIQNLGKKVAFVGDGINDAPALVQADLGIAIGTGTDVAVENGDIVISKGDPLKIVEAMNLSRYTFKIIKQNLFWAFIYNTVGIPLAAFGYLSPIFASFAMAMSSVSVVLNSLRIKKIKEKTI